MHGILIKYVIEFKYYTIYTDGNTFMLYIIPQFIHDFSFENLNYIKK